MQLEDCVIPDYPEIPLWYVIGLPGRLYPTKIVAEAATRKAFPDDFDSYRRVFYRNFVREDYEA